MTPGQLAESAYYLVAGGTLFAATGALLVGAVVWLVTRWQAGRQQ